MVNSPRNATTQSSFNSRWLTKTSLTSDWRGMWRATVTCSIVVYEQRVEVNPHLQFSMPELCQNTARQYTLNTKVSYVGYNQQLSTKSVIHDRITLMKIPASILMDGSMLASTSQADVLSNVKNKGHLIMLLTTHHIITGGVDIQQVTSYTDSMIVY